MQPILIRNDDDDLVYLPVLLENIKRVLQHGLTG
jgi:hypothetical protein